ncbi:MAG: DUF2141 domain-containing protein [Deltaproteobacteria bacterium]|nr:DUF2141 domain-containing protein [Deltaproteobacteria bacterium]MBI2499874.1 DUF2141 domain-containing protein [Deltaproteobacteria bacterium]MBI4196233.1 DUF2141 domain-containing protein [Deltaproteobacteria bacterium]
MTRERLFLSGVILIFLMASPVFGDNSATLEVEVTGIKNKKGEVGVALFESVKGYPTHLEYAYETEWIPYEKGEGSLTFNFEGLPPDDYAVSVLHDVNANRKVDRTGLGFPKEGVGFSNDQKVTLKAPSFKKSKFDLVAGETKKIIIRLEYRKD